MTTNPRRVIAVEQGTPTSDGAGVKLTRLIGTNTLADLDPFLLLDHFGSDTPQDYIAGFPDHPHRGFETVTIMHAGHMRHQDNQGHSGIIGPGGVQWMTAGRGIVHSEMPEQERGTLSGFQLWLNLPAELKMQSPRYQEFDAGDIPVDATSAGVAIKVISGSTDAGVAGATADIDTKPLLFDVQIEAKTTFRQAVASGANAFVAAYRGGIAMESEHGESIALTSPRLAVLGPGTEVRLTATEAGASFLFAAAQPLGEPVARYGPFVMNTERELKQAMSDYRAGRF